MRLTRSWHLSTLLFGILVAVGGCRDEAGVPLDETPPPDAAEGLELQFGVQEATYAPGDTIRAIIRVANRTSEPRTLEFSSSQRFDVILLDSTEAPVHSWSADKSFAQGIGVETLEVGGELVYDVLMIAPDSAGGYTLKGAITATDVVLESSLPIVIDG